MVSARGFAAVGTRRLPSCKLAFRAGFLLLQDGRAGPFDVADPDPPARPARPPAPRPASSGPTTAPGSPAGPSSGCRHRKTPAPPPARVSPAATAPRPTPPHWSPRCTDVLLQPGPQGRQRRVPRRRGRQQLPDHPLARRAAAVSGKRPHRRPRAFVSRQRLLLGQHRRTGPRDVPIVFLQPGPQGRQRRVPRRRGRQQLPDHPLARRAAAGIVKRPHRRPRARLRRQRLLLGQHRRTGPRDVRMLLLQPGPQGRQRRVPRRRGRQQLPDHPLARRAAAGRVKRPHRRPRARLAGSDCSSANTAALVPAMYRCLPPARPARPPAPRPASSGPTTAPGSPAGPSSGCRHRKTPAPPPARVRLPAATAPRPTPPHWSPRCPDTFPPARPARPPAPRPASSGPTTAPGSPAGPSSGCRHRKTPAPPPARVRLPAATAPRPTPPHWSPRCPDLFLQPGPQGRQRRVPRRRGRQQLPDHPLARRAAAVIGKRPHRRPRAASPAATAPRPTPPHWSPRCTDGLPPARPARPPAPRPASSGPTTAPGSPAGPSSGCRHRKTPAPPPARQPPPAATAPRPTPPHWSPRCPDRLPPARPARPPAPRPASSGPTTAPGSPAGPSSGCRHRKTPAPPPARASAGSDCSSANTAALVPAMSRFDPPARPARPPAPRPASSGPTTAPGSPAGPSSGCRQRKTPAPPPARRPLLPRSRPRCQSGRYHGTARGRRRSRSAGAARPANPPQEDDALLIRCCFLHLPAPKHDADLHLVAAFQKTSDVVRL